MMDFKQKKYFDRLSYGRMILLFKACGSYSPHIKHHPDRSEEKSLDRGESGNSPERMALTLFARSLDAPDCTDAPCTHVLQCD